MPTQTNSKSTKARRTTSVKRTSNSKSQKKLPKLAFRQWIGLAIIAVMTFGLTWLIYTRNFQAASTTDKLQVTATFYPIYNFAQQVGGQLAEVRNATPPGADAHSFEPSPQDLVQAHQSDLFIYQDTAMEPWVNKFLPDYDHTAIGISQHTSHRDLEGELDHHHHDDYHADDHDHLQDPHLWTDPVMAQQIVKAIIQGFSQADPQNKAIYQANGDSYIAKLKQLNLEFSQGLANCQHRTIVTSHAAFSYLAERYNITVLPISGLSPEQEPSATKLAELKSIIRQQQISTIFFESQASQRLASTLASETGSQTSILNPIESLSQSQIDQGQDYLTVQRSNLANLRHALACR